ncbi:carbohydrate ABC transporter permease [Anaerotalea alkaliphila]|nr:sugar ABC transporter permease [Anaerotalea alkaliphila]
MSLRGGRLGRPQEFVGLANYAALFKDSYFYEAFGNTFLFVFVSTPIIVLLGLVFALVSNSKHRGAKVVKIAAFLPYILSISVITSIWVYTFKPYIGFLNSYLIRLGVVGDQVLWFDRAPLAWATIIIATTWWTVGFNTILFIAGLQEIPDELYEASSIDGATKWQQLKYITLPSLKGVTVMIVLLQIIASFKIFGQPFLMTGGGPGTSTRPLVQYIYEKGFKDWNAGYASAMSYMLLLVIIVVAFVYNKVTSNDGGGKGA